MDKSLDVREVRANFIEIYGEGALPKVVRAPGVVTLLGSHVDLHDGFIIPAAIGHEIMIAVRPTISGEISIHHFPHREHFRFDSRLQINDGGGWSERIKGIVHSLGMNGYEVSGAQVTIESNLLDLTPKSMNAALEVAVALGFSEAFNYGLSDEFILEVCRFSHEMFFGFRETTGNCAAVLKSRDSHLIMLDCANNDSVEIPFPQNASIVIIDTHISGEAEDINLKSRHGEVDSAIRILSKIRPGLGSARDLSVNEYDSLSEALEPTTRNRLRHVVEEIERVRKGAEALSFGDLRGFGALLYHSHESQKENFEINLPDINLIIDAARESDGVYGATMTGSGLNGKAVSIVENSIVDRFANFVADRFKTEFGSMPDIFTTRPEDGASRLA